MATGVNNNAAVVVVGRTAPVPPGQQVSANSVPVVIASDQSAIPVEEQNKQQSEVALSLLGIPRSEVALGIFADVNTYDVNPTEWSVFPEQFGSADIYNDAGQLTGKYTGILGDLDWGLTHIAEEAGAMIEAPPDEVAILTSKRFFRYQPGRVSAATFGVKLNRGPYTVKDNANSDVSVKNPTIKKYGIFDKFDGYYFESRNDGYGDNFTVVRRTQSIIRDNPLDFGNQAGEQDQDYAWVGVPQVESNRPTYLNAAIVLRANKKYIQEVAAQALDDGSEADKCRRDAGLVLEGIIHDLTYGGNASTVYNTLRFFNKKTKGVYLDNIGTEIARYGVIRTVINNLCNGQAPSANSSTALDTYTNVTPNITYHTASSLGLGTTVTGGSAAQGLLDILLVALGRDSGNTPLYSSIPDPVGSAAGEMAILRDGLVMIHGAAHDPSLLKPITNYSITDLQTGWLKVAVPAGADLLQVGQSVSFQKNEGTGYFADSSGNRINDGSIWYIENIQKHEVSANTLYQFVKLCANPSNEEKFTGVGGTNPTNPWGTQDSSDAYGTLGSFAISGSFDANGGAKATSTQGFQLRTPTPFLLPSDARQYQGQQYTDESRPGKDGVPAGTVDGCFPYLYPPRGAASPGSQGYIDSAFDAPSELRAQMNYVNKRLYKNWCWFNVDPKYYKVYEYRVPRSRMSQEKLNGKVTDIIYSDNVLDKKAGTPVVEETTGEQKTFESVWDLDPTKVTMYKIEFSWYGAVGATFLAYVPISNNEARWVRVHHLRASNQLKVASLGNATLPITYLVYGGGLENGYGYLNASRNLNTESGYGSCSQQLTKYGASYYIDGGDRGTVRLFSYASDKLEEIGGSKYDFSNTDHTSLFQGRISYVNSNKSAGDANPVLDDRYYVNAPYLQFNGTWSGFESQGGRVPNISDYYMNARVVTNTNTDQDVRVIYADSSTNRLYLSRILNATTGAINLIVDRPKPLVGVKCRTEINGVRNRVQIYPTRLATGVTSQSESMVVELIKTPVFQTFTNPNGLLYVNSGGIDIGRRGKRTLLPVGIGANQITMSAGNLLGLGESTWGYFRYTIKGDTSGLAFTTLGLLDRDKNSGKYYFSAYQVSIDDHIIRGTFLPAGRWSGPGPQSPNLSAVTSPYPTSVLSRLSAVETDSEQRSPIPGTGTKITTLFSPNSGEQYELSPYFDYNKDYLSFPLTDIQETLYICASSKSSFLSSGNYVNRGEILASITWEEQ
jgi:hypothetical protein